MSKYTIFVNNRLFKQLFIIAGELLSYGLRVEFFFYGNGYVMNRSLKANETHNVLQVIGIFE